MPVAATEREAIHDYRLLDGHPQPDRGVPPRRRRVLGATAPAVSARTRPLSPARRAFPPTPTPSATRNGSARAMRSGTSRAFSGSPSRLGVGSPFDARRRTEAASLAVRRKGGPTNAATGPPSARAVADRAGLGAGSGAVLVGSGGDGLGEATRGPRVAAMAAAAAAASAAAASEGRRRGFRLERRREGRRAARRARRRRRRRASRPIRASRTSISEPSHRLRRPPRSRRSRPSARRARASRRTRVPRRRVAKSRTRERGLLLLGDDADKGAENAEEKTRLDASFGAASLSPRAVSPTNARPDAGRRRAIGGRAARCDRGDRGDRDERGGGFDEDGRTFARRPETGTGFRRRRDGGPGLRRTRPLLRDQVVHRGRRAQEREVRVLDQHEHRQRAARRGVFDRNRRRDRRRARRKSVTSSDAPPNARTRRSWSSRAKPSARSRVAGGARATRRPTDRPIARTGIRRNVHRLDPRIPRAFRPTATSYDRRVPPFPERSRR